MGGVFCVCVDGAGKGVFLYRRTSRHPPLLPSQQRHLYPGPDHVCMIDDNAALHIARPKGRAALSADWTGASPGAWCRFRRGRCGWLVGWLAQSGAHEGSEYDTGVQAPPPRDCPTDATPANHAAANCRPRPGSTRRFASQPPARLRAARIAEVDHATVALRRKRGENSPECDRHSHCPGTAGLETEPLVTDWCSGPGGTGCRWGRPRRGGRLAGGRLRKAPRWAPHGGQRTTTRQNDPVRATFREFLTDCMYHRAVRSIFHAQADVTQREKATKKTKNPIPPPPKMPKQA